MPFKSWLDSPLQPPVTPLCHLGRVGLSNLTGYWPNLDSESLSVLFCSSVFICCFCSSQIHKGMCIQHTDFNSRLQLQRKHMHILYASLSKVTVLFLRQQPCILHQNKQCIVYTVCLIQNDTTQKNLHKIDLLHFTLTRVRPIKQNKNVVPVNIMTVTPVTPLSNKFMKRVQNLCCSKTAECVQIRFHV